MSELTPRIAILASGGGSTAEAFIHATQSGIVDGEVGLVVCNNPPEKAGIYGRISRLNRQYGLDIETALINSHTHPEGKVDRGQTRAESAAICERLRRGDFGHVACMGYMKKIGDDLIDEYGWRPGYTSIYQARMTNTHPGPLPETTDTYGIHTSEKVLKLALTVSHHTVHLVSAGIDQGPILAAHPVEIRPDDTPRDLFDRVQIVEKATLPYALDRFLRDQAAYIAALRSV